MFYEAQSVKDSLTNDDVLNILDELEANPYEKDGNIYCRTICHDGDSGDKLVYFSNTGYFYCRTHCGTIGDIFDLLSNIVPHDNFNELVDWVAERMEEKPTSGKPVKRREHPTEEDLIKSVDVRLMDESIQLPEYDNPIEHYPRPHILSWEREGISKSVCDAAGVCYDPINGAVLIPHYDREGRLIGIKSRTLVKEEEQGGKYRMYCGTDGTCYKFPVLLDVYGLDKAKESIAANGTAYVLEAEKSVLEARSMFRSNNVPVVSVNGSNVSKHQLRQLYECGARTLFICFDRDYETEQDAKYFELMEKYRKIADKYSQTFEFKFIVDKENLLSVHDSPTDKGKDVFLSLAASAITL